MKRGVGIALAVVVSFLLMGIVNLGGIDNGNSNAFPTGNILFVNSAWIPDEENDKYSSIQEAIDHAGNGDIIYVFDGTYEENIFVDKSLQIVGESNVLLSGIGNHNAVYIMASGVTISNFTITDGLMSGVLIDGDLGGHDATLKDCTIMDNGMQGVLIHNTYGNAIINCSIYGNPIGVKEQYSFNNTIVNSYIYSGDWGVFFDGCRNSSVEGSILYDNENKSINIENSNNVTIKNSTMYDNFCGIRLKATSNSSIKGCNITENIVGLRIDGSSNNTVTNCEIYSNIGYGIYITDFTLPSTGNLIHHNNIMGNGENAYDECGSIWNTSIGNYWDDYSGEDADGDGMGDSPYSIYGGGEDSHPLMYQIMIPSLFVWVDDDFNSSTPGWGIDHFDSIQDAINDLKDNGICYVHPGNYEGCVVSKSLSLTGENGANISSTGDGIFVTASNVTIRGFSISAQDNGIKIQNADNVNIYRCSAGDAIFGIYMVNAKNCNIADSEFYNNIKGMYIFNSSGIQITNDSIHDNHYFGVEISHASSHNQISDCQVADNGNYGVYITQNSNWNRIYHNNFINNTAYDICSNNWGSSYEDVLGNYWSDYGGSDANRDGMGDSPYMIDGGGADSYPLMNKITDPPSFVWVNPSFNSTFPGWGLDHFVSIGEAAAEVETGGSAFVFPGVYAENVVLDRDITISGAGSGDAIIEGNGAPAFYITGQNVGVYGFGVRNCWNDAGISIFGLNAGIFDCDVYDSYYGIYVHAVNITLEGCSIHGNSFTGLMMESAQQSKVMNCSIYENNNGVVVSSSSHNAFGRNSITDNSIYGLKMEQFSNHNTFTYNVFENNIYGLYAKQSSSNTIYLNDFLGNVIQASDSGINNWDNSGIGNYWDDYSGSDNNFDGIGDTTYPVPGGTNIDHYPLVRRAGFPVPYFIYIPSDSIDTETDVRFIDMSVDLDGSIVSWTWDFGDGEQSTLQSVTHRYADNGFYNVILEIVDDDGHNGTAETEIYVANVPPYVNFTWIPPDPTDRDTVNFVDTSVDTDGFIVNWTWNFGDGSTGYGKNVTHAYAGNGTYSVILTVTDDDGDLAALEKNVSVWNVPPDADFAYSPLSPSTADMIEFSDYSVDTDGFIVNWTWNFGDGSTGYGKNVTHSYADNGTYAVILTVRDNDNDTDNITKYVNVSNVAPVADLSFIPPSPKDVDTVHFTDESYDTDGSVVAWFWDFGDGYNSTLQNPTHVYTDDGTYTVTLTVTDDDGASDSISKIIEIKNAPPDADFYYVPPSPDDLDNVSFYDTSGDADGSVVAWYWVFGDGNTSHEQNPSHSYKNNGVYTVRLTVTDDDGANDSVIHSIIISNIPPVASFTYAPANITDTDDVVFTDNSSDADGIVVNTTWDFGDGNISYDKNATHRYGDDGTYYVTLTVTDDDGASSSFTSKIVVLNVKPVAAFTYTPEKPQEGKYISFQNLSSDADGVVVNATWDFGDGFIEKDGSVLNHKYAKKGTYTVTLTVTDDDGASSSISKTIVVKGKEETSGFDFVMLVAAVGILLVMWRSRKGIWRMR
ncbi:MAG: PKD domain-containing protein [Thermoplasmata archaeon]|nr:MAG: PKD domain-containing protein [Thermoplasmata archaeon]